MGSTRARPRRRLQSRRIRSSGDRSIARSGDHVGQCQQRRHDHGAVSHQADRLRDVARAAPVTPSASSCPMPWSAARSAASITATRDGRQCRSRLGEAGRRAFRRHGSPTVARKNNAIVGGFVVGLGMDVAFCRTSSCAANGNSSASRQVNGIRADDQYRPRRLRREVLAPPLSRTFFRRLSRQLTAPSRLAYLRQWDTPPQRGAPIWKDRL